MSSYLETFSITELKKRKSFLLDQLDRVNNLINEYEKNNYIKEDLDNDNESNIKSNDVNEKKIKIKIKK